MNARFFSLDNQWNVVHLPERPNGFGVLVLGDKDHFVEGSTSLWIQHIGRSQLVRYLLDKGYTVFYSNLYGRHWGSDKSLRLAKQLYHLVMKQEILNKRIHVLAEGMGALLALRLVESNEDFFRGMALLNPCLDFRAHVEHEKQNKLFYKQLIKEIRQAYGIEEEELNEFLNKLPQLTDYQSTIPVKIWAMTNNISSYPIFHRRHYEEHRLKLGSPVALSLYLPEQKYLFERSLVHFFEENEKVL
ncbi:alpha/beta hydrolase [Bacillus songklensis]|uniref:Alpha/beta hydrolase n=1 Tax=Bacillus songklensis TaxID=1069116 RepID=A0ABV8B0B3_9BACI